MKSTTQKPLDSSLFIPPRNSEKVEADIKLDFTDVLIKPQNSSIMSRNDVDLTENGVIPLMIANMDTTGTYDVFNASKGTGVVTVLHKHYSESELIEFFSSNDTHSNQLFYSMGTSEQDFEKFVNCSKVLNNICIDVANGYIDNVVETVEKVRATLPDAFIMVGNVIDGSRTIELIKAGATCVKIGVGPGSVCKTRSVAGVGCPQFSAILECAQAAHSVGGLVCADGGCASSGDIAKAYGAGADFVMIAGLVSGAKEINAEEVEVNGVRNNVFYGMSSKKAIDKHNGGLQSYRASEGRTVLVPITGTISEIVLELLGGVRSAMTYVGASNLAEFREKTTFIRVNRQLNDVFAHREV